MTEEEIEKFVSENVNLAHLYFQFYTIDQNITYEDFKSRVGEKSHWESLLVDYADEIARNENYALYIQRIIDLL